MAVTRREAFLAGAAAAVAAGIGGGVSAAQKIVAKGRLKQSVSRWCYGKIPMPEFCTAVADMGLTAIDLLEEPDWAIVRDHGLVCSMRYAGGGSIRDGLNVKANHDAIVKNFEAKIPKAARARRHAGGQLAGSGDRGRRDRIPGLPGARVRADARSTGVAERSGGAL
jgi:hydroxypyruvate isomerase